AAEQEPHGSSADDQDVGESCDGFPFGASGALHCGVQRCPFLRLASWRSASRRLSLLLARARRSAFCLRNPPSKPLREARGQRRVSTRARPASTTAWMTSLAGL